MAVVDYEAQLTALEDAIASGALRVKYSDKEITYRSIDEMLRVRDFLLKKLGRQGASRVVPDFSKGL